MNYRKIYDDMIFKARNSKFQSYTEKHHVIPKSIGGSDDKSNMVRMPARWHYIAHLLLCKIYQNQRYEYDKMLYACICMRYGRVDGRRSFRFNSKLYALMKEKYASIRSSMMKTKKNHMKNKVWIFSMYEKRNMIWSKEDENLPDGYIYGRCNDFETLILKLQSKGISIDEFTDMRRKYIGKRIRLKKNVNDALKYKIAFDRFTRIVQNKNEQQERDMQRDIRLSQMYEDYVKNGFEYVKEKYDYKKTRENLVIAFRRHVKNYDKNILLKTSLRIKKESGKYEQSSKNRKMSIEEKRKYFSDIYKFFKEFGFEKTVEKYNWQSSRNALIMNFKNYADEYIPNHLNRQNNKK